MKDYKTYECKSCGTILNLLIQPEKCSACESRNIDLITPKDELEDEIEEVKSFVEAFFDKKDLANQILDHVGMHYDESGLWWIWSSNEKRWLMKDEIDILNMVSNISHADTIKATERAEIIQALKQVSRQRKPEEPQPTWIQFDTDIVDVLSGEKFEASSKYFITNPIPYKLSESTETPNMDRIFEEWVGKDNVKTLYEIMAYCLLSDYPISRIFCFIGGGSNGKSCYLNLLRKFIGGTNCCSTELDTLIASRFEVTRLHKKLVCQMGETNFGEMSKTSLLKKLSGRDLIGFEYKNKTPFESINYAKILIATNNLPATTDKTVGFYRRWMIIDFPNQFGEKKDILSEIPEEEYNNLALKSLNLLKELLEKREFTNEGSIEERMKKYESKSNFLNQFMEEYTEEGLNEYITKNDFKKKFVEWCKSNRHREMSDVAIAKAMKSQGIGDSRKYMDWMFDGKGGYARIWLDLKWKN